jgi:hypothetical protein
MVVPLCGGEMNGLANARVATAPANVPSHGGVDLFACGSGGLLEQRRGGHHLTRLAITALHDVDREPRLLEASADVGVTEMFDRHHLGRTDLPHSRLARSARDAIDVDGAGPAEPATAPELRSDQPEFVPEHPQ